MVIRLGIGAFHDPTGGPTNKGGPAYSFDQVVRYTDLNSYFLGVGPTSPTSVSGFWKDGQKRPVTYQYNFGIQRDIGFKTILDVAYVGSNTHHNIQSWNFNALPAGVRFLPQFRDPTVTATAASPGALPDNFLRPIVASATSRITGPGTTERYDSLQVSANRRFAHGLQFTGAYTWAGGTSNGWFQNNPLPSSAARQRNTLVQKEAAVFTYTWDIPTASRFVPGKSAKRSSTAGSCRGLDLRHRPVSNVSGGTTDSFDFTGGGESCGTYDPDRQRCAAARSEDRRSVVQHRRISAASRARRYRQQLQQRQVHPSGLQQPRPVALQGVQDHGAQDAAVPVGDVQHVSIIRSSARSARRRSSTRPASRPTARSARPPPRATAEK